MSFKNTARGFAASAEIALDAAVAGHGQHAD